MSCEVTAWSVDTSCGRLERSGHVAWRSSAQQRRQRRRVVGVGAAAVAAGAVAEDAAGMFRRRDIVDVYVVVATDGVHCADQSVPYAPVEMLVRRLPSTTSRLVPLVDYHSSRPPLVSTRARL